MNVVVFGSRTIDKQSTVDQEILKAPCTPTEIVSGGADGVDSCAKQFAEENDLPYTEFEADWDEHGKSAGPIRNAQMAEYADAGIAVWDGQSSGTRDMIEKLLDEGKSVYVTVP